MSSNNGQESAYSSIPTYVPPQQVRDSSALFESPIAGVKPRSTATMTPSSSQGSSPDLAPHDDSSNPDQRLAAFVRDNQPPKPDPDWVAKPASKKVAVSAGKVASKEATKAASEKASKVVPQVVVEMPRDPPPCSPSTKRKRLQAEDVQSLAREPPAPLLAMMQTHIPYGQRSQGRR
ncbi:hypothetical protein B9Z65_3812 [Elsinoe australis]|uniref:Uncharacterized protein n=1 Tax=Elsinoe australis TaxID=40998 RepID=A0A2P8AG87_9PEZI|nr:hypothetical protein B9Z65_3812 [Elsinoe australis]